MPTQNVNVLLVEDNDVDVETVIRAFRKHRISNPITIARNGLEALAVLRGENGQSIERPLIVLLDLNMPKMNGLEFLREIRADEELKSTTVFVLTTSDDEGDLKAAHEMNVAGYVLKDEVGDHLRDLLDMLGCWWRISRLPT